MGLFYHDARALWDARLAGASFQETLTVGHQSLYLHPSEVSALTRDYLAREPAAAPPLADYQFGEYADRFLRTFLGVAKLEILDNSAYEGATAIHDLNQPLPESLWGRFDAVIDGGSLEHIFNFPVAIGNLMRLVKVGGRLVVDVPANNWCGHGFYQFSPEVMFRIFSPENGFELKRVALFEARTGVAHMTTVRGGYAVTDPVQVHTRVGLLSRQPVMLLAEAVKTEDVPPFRTTPQQSDYVALWNEPPPPPKTGGLRGLVKKVVAKLPLSWQGRILGYYVNREYSFANRRFYKKL
jgi:hypothetical protein